MNILNLQDLKMSTTRKILTLHDRVAGLKRLDSGTSCRMIAAELHCIKTQVGRIRLDRMAIRAEWSSGGWPVKRRKTTYEELNNLVWEWFTTSRSKDLPVSGCLIHVLYCTDMQCLIYGGVNDFDSVSADSEQ